MGSRIGRWFSSPQRFLVLGGLIALNAALDLALGNTTMAVLFGMLAIALLVRAWRMWRVSKSSLSG
jgi:hypothetical protein